MSGFSSVKSFVHNDEPDEYAFFIDDSTGAPLKSDLVTNARKVEMEFFKRMGVYEYSTIDTALQLTGKRPIGVRWVDINTGDNNNPDYRSRLVATYINTGHDDDLFAATPRIEALKALLREAASRRAEDNEFAILFADVRRAYFNAKATRDIFIQLPPEDPNYGKQGVCGKLRVSMYGTIDVAQNWERECASKLVS